MMNTGDRCLEEAVDAGRLPFPGRTASMMDSAVVAKGQGEVDALLEELRNVVPATRERPAPAAARAGGGRKEVRTPKRGRKPRRPG
jgi:hypothetical protein